MIRTLIVDDQNLDRQGLRSLLGLVDDVLVIGEAADGQGAIDALDSDCPDLMLLDLRMPGKGGIEVLEEFGARDALPPTLVLTTFDDDALVLETIRAGARGFLLHPRWCQGVLAQGRLARPPGRGDPHGGGRRHPHPAGDHPTHPTRCRLAGE